MVHMPCRSERTPGSDDERECRSAGIGIRPTALLTQRNGGTNELGEEPRKSPDILVGRVGARVRFATAMTNDPATSDAWTPDMSLSSSLPGSE
jgi:hypothetical protein